ncbi:LiaF transmembrane domain-containing protein [Mangrovibacterium lignilyticum]|uniref:LiaF transmembrane domain-containing protein n=1 Tax=Mangrovibacterium lignilyticum TaxID=2668052 RepID=UPI0013D46140|nr:DUF5668 domain-containing protein [Mangrovibacterium lignilyticum]
MERRGNRGFFAGVVFIAIGAVLILQRLNLIPWSLSDILISWQMLLIAIGALAMMKGNRVMGVILIGLGTFFILPELFDVPYEVRRLYWPAMLVLIGVALVYRQRGSGPSSHQGTEGRDFDEFDDFVIFGGREIFINSKQLKGGRSMSVFGGIEYDLRQATLSPQGAVIDCTCLFGGTGLKVPLDWNVRNEVSTIFGAFTDKRGDTFQQGQFDPSKTIVLKGITLFGGVEIKHV